MMGMNALADLLAPTLGPVGGIVANQRDFQRQAELLDDSATAVRRILNLGDPRMDVGAMLVRSMVWRVVQRAGDGGATAAIFARALYREAVRVIAGGANPMRVAKGVNLAVDKVVEVLRTQSRPVSGPDQLAHIALTVIRDKPLAQVLGEMSYLLGADAHVTIEKYVASYLQQSYLAGAATRATIASMYLYTDPPTKSAIGGSGVLALIDGKLDDVGEGAALLQAAAQAGAGALTVIAGQVSDAVIGLFMQNSRQGDRDAKGKPKQESKKPVIIVAKPKDIGDARRAVFDDLALLTGATVLGRAWSKSTGAVTPDDLGRILRSELSNEIVMIVPEEQNNPAVQQRSAELRTRLAAMTLDDEDRPVLVQRLAMLNGGMGTLKIGAESKLDREVRAQNAERALKVLSAAQNTGVAPGGGAAFFHAMPALDGIEAEDDVRFGVQIVQRALAAPLRQILENAHVPSSSVEMDRIRRAGPTATYDVLEGRVVDAYAAGVLDAVGVLTTVLQTAASAALMALTTDTIVYHKKPEQATNP